MLAHLTSRGGRVRRTRATRHLPIGLGAIALVLAPGGPARAAADEAARDGLTTSVPPRAIGNGAWSYFGDPRAVHSGGRTFVGWADPAGYTNVATLADGRVLEHRRLGPRLPVDDHNNPSIFLRPDGRLTVFYSAHNGRRMYYRISTRPHSLASLSPARVLPTNTPGKWGFTYPNPLRVDGRLWLMFRGGNWQPSFSIEERRWIPARTLVRGPRASASTKAPLGPGRRHRPYAKYESDGDRVHAVFTEANLSAYPNTIRYAQFDGGGIFDARGRRVAALGSAPAVKRLDLVRAYRGLHQWALDIAVDDEGRPVIVYERRAARAEYWYARFDGRRWRNHLVARYASRAPPPGAVGAATLDHEDPATVYLSRVAVAGQGHEIEVWTTPDHGSTWLHRALTDTPSRDDLRPVSPRGLTAFEQVIWFAGHRAHWTSFDTQLLVSLIPARFRVAMEPSRRQASGHQPVVAPHTP